MKTSIEVQKEKVMSEIAGITRVAKRVEVLTDLGYSVHEYPMGSGGVGQVVEMSDCYRIQIGYGHGKYNYAYAVVISK